MYFFLQNLKKCKKQKLDLVKLVSIKDNNLTHAANSIVSIFIFYLRS